MSGRAGRGARLCPSAQADAPGAVVIGVVGGTAEEPRVVPLEAAVPVTDELLELTAPATPGEVLRVAAPCAGCRCAHFQDHRCALAGKVANHLAPVADELPPCPIRAHCRWFSQEGGEACRRCPQVVTERWHPAPLMAAVAHPSVTPDEVAGLGGEARPGS